MEGIVVAWSCDRLEVRLRAKKKGSGNYYCGSCCDCLEAR